MDQLRKHIGKGADQYLPEFLSPEDLRTIGKKIEQCHSEVFKEEYLPQVRPFPKVRELFERIKRDGKRIAVATSGKKGGVAHLQENRADRRPDRLRNHSGRRWEIETGYGLI